MAAPKEVRGDQCQEEREHMRLTRAQAGPFVVGALGIALGLAYLSIALGFPRGTLAQPGPGTYALIVGALMVVAAIGVSAEALLGKLMEEVRWPLGWARWRVVFTVLSIAAYVLLVPYLGHLVMSSLVMLAILHLMELPSWPLKIGLALAIGIGSYAIFVVLLGVPLPAGPWDR
jgi:putative tricarboxylic transport membrane protein